MTQTNRLHDEEDLTCIRIVVRSLEGPTRTALVALLRGTARGSLAQVLAGSASSSSSAPCTAAPVGV